MAKKLKKEKVNIDVVSFGEDEDNTDILNKFISTINGKEGTGSHLVTIPPGPHLSDALVSSPIVQVFALIMLWVEILFCLFREKMVSELQQPVVLSLE